MQKISKEVLENDKKLRKERAKRNRPPHRVYLKKCDSCAHFKLSIWKSNKHQAKLCKLCIEHHASGNSEPRK